MTFAISNGALFLNGLRKSSLAETCKKLGQARGKSAIRTILKSRIESEIEPVDPDPPATVAEPPPSIAPARSRSELAFFAWAALVLRSVLTMAAGFITTPYLLRFLGAERLGAFRASQQWMSYLVFLYVGLGPTLAVLLLKPASRGDLAGTVG